MTKYLNDKTITGIEIAEDKKAMRFLVEGAEPIVAKADGDCCSSTWIEHIELPALGFPAKVLSVAALDLPGTVEDDDGCTAVYGLKITTDKGDLVIDYRNSSNGYYGETCHGPDDDYFYGGVYGQNVSDESGSRWQPTSNLQKGPEMEKAEEIARGIFAATFPA